MSNKPVAWTDGKGNYFDKNSFFPVDDLIPLYTQQRPHNTVLVPCDKLAEMQAEIEALKQSKFKDDNKVNFELTDDEILDTFDPHFDTDIEDKELIKFARAILRKAQEK